MKKNVFGRKLQRDKNERTALFKSLMSSLILKERIQTSHAKAKAIKPQIEKLVTKALKNTTSTERIIASSLNPNAVEKFVKDVAPRFKDRKGGYTRIIKIAPRFGDKSPMAILEWVEMPKAVAVVTPKTKQAKVKKAIKPVAKKEVKKTAVKKPARKRTK